MFELGSQVSSIVITKAALESLVKMLVLQWKSRRAKKGAETAICFSQSSPNNAQNERETLLAQEGDALTFPAENATSIETLSSEEREMIRECQSPPYDGTLEDYNDAVIQHGFLSLFGAAFPMIAFVIVASSFVETNMGAYKLLRLHRRPDSDEARDVGGWDEIVDALSALSVLSTAGLLTVTTPALQRVADERGLFANTPLAFLVFEHILIFLGVAVLLSYNVTPLATLRERSRREFFAASVFGVGWKPHFQRRPNRRSNYATDAEKRRIDSSEGLGSLST